MNDPSPRRDYLWEVIAERNALQSQLHDIRMRLAHLVGYWRGSPSVSTQYLIELLEMCVPKPPTSAPESEAEAGAEGASEVEEWEDTSRTVWAWKQHDAHHHGKGYILVETEGVQGGLLCPVCDGIVLVPAPSTPES